MPQRTPQRPSSLPRYPRTTSNRRPAPSRGTKESSSGGKGLLGALGGLGGAKKKSGGGIGKSAGGLAALAGLAGVAMKNRSQIASKLGRGQQHEAEVVAPATPPTVTSNSDSIH